MSIWKKKKGLIIGLCIFILTGCNAKTNGKNNEDTNKKDIKDFQTNTMEENKSKENGNSENSGNENTSNDKTKDIREKMDANSLYKLADLTGGVVDFSDSGCTISPYITGDDGKTVMGAAPGYESEETNISVSYQEDCEVWIATIHISSGIAEMERVSVSDIKKQANIIVYGSFKNERRILAEKIIICHHVKS